MTTHDPVALARRFVQDVWNAEREESVYELVDEACSAVAGPGPDGSLAWHRDRRSSFPDLRYEIVEIVGDADRAAIHWHATGTQHGQFGPVPPTGRSVTYSGATFLRFDEGKIVAVWSVNELFGVLQQLGVEMTSPTP